MKSTWFFLLFSFVFLLPDLAQACPYCVGSLTNPKDQYLVYILSAFIVFTYIPMYFLYRMIKKNKDINAQVAAASNGKEGE